MSNMYVDFLNGDAIALLGFAHKANAENRVPTEEEAEALAALESLTALKEYLSTHMPISYRVSEYKSGHIHITCPDAEYGHPPIVLPLYSNKLAPRAKIVCPHCTKAKANPNVIVGFLCRHHPDVILKRGMHCPKCETSGVATALNGGKIELVNTGRLREYNCPLHGNFELPSQRQKVECPTCQSLDGVNAYAATLRRDDKEAIIALKARAKPVIKHALKHGNRHDLLSPHRIALIDNLVKRCYEPEDNLHLLHIFPTTTFIFGKWLVPHVRDPNVPASYHDYLLPLPRHLVDAAESNQTVLMDEATVACDRQWRTAHWSRHKEFI